MAALSRAAMLATMGLLAALLFPAAMSTRPSLISMTTGGIRQLPEGLSYDFYKDTCPTLEIMVREAVERAIASDVGVVAGLLRIFFHDCFPQGCDASILLTGANSELKMPQNAGLRQNVLDLIESIRETVHQECGAIVSCADISNLATKHAVMQSGVPGNLVPGYLLPLGRKDSLSPATTQEVQTLPGPSFNVTQLVDTFARRGLNEVDLVALSGAHTIGNASCPSFMNRRGENDEFVQKLKSNCTRFPAAPLQDLDVTTPNTFDNMYYHNLQKNMGVLHSDMQLTLNATISQLVDFFAADQGWFFATFSTSMSNLAHLEGKPAIIGEVRRNCFKVNGAVELSAQRFVASA
ncbi:hypothetical protein ACQ4PT_039051 [Festuca glaucescens]